MSRIGASIICFATIFLLGQVALSAQTQMSKTAEGKAIVLEKEIVAEGNKAASASPSEKITRPEAQGIDPDGEKSLNDVITCFSRTIYWEARGEQVASMEAIANVVMNRLGHEGFPNTVCGVVKQGQEQGACQFSWWCDGRSDDAEEDESYAITKEIARKALNRQLIDQTKGAMYFHQKKVKPSWAKDYIKAAEIGKFVFYKPHGDKAK